jgi:transcriptional regulator with XRE-family HTH domain
MKGSELKEILRKEGVVLMSLAENIGMSQQNLSAAFTRDDVKSGLLEKIARSLGKPVGFFYGEASENAPAQQPQSSEDSVLDLLKLKDEQLLIAMKQTSKAQEQMDKVLEVLTSPAQAQTVTPAVYFAKGDGGVEPVISRPYTQRLRANARRLSALTGPHVLGPAEIRVSAASEPKIK